MFQDDPGSISLFESKHNSARIALRSANLHGGGGHLQCTHVRSGWTGHLDLLDLNLHLLGAIRAETSFQPVLVDARIDALDGSGIQC